MKKHILEITAISISICSIFISMLNLNQSISNQNQGLPKTLKIYNAEQIQELSKTKDKLNTINISEKEKIAILKNIYFE